MQGKLFVVATPIGNLSDITLRAIETLKNSDVIVSEDTRVSSKLLAHFEIKKSLVSFNEHSDKRKIDRIISEILDGKIVSLITDAGTPGVSDPGGVLVQEAYTKNIEVIGIPGASAVTLALSVAGFFAGEFIFIGYFPKKKGRQTLIGNLVSEKRTVVFYESPYRIKKTLNDLSEKFPEREIFVGRELTKKFEEIYRGKLSEVNNEVKEKGEFVVVLRGTK